MKGWNHSPTSTHLGTTDVSENGGVGYEPLTPLPEYRMEINRRMKHKIKEQGHKNFGISHDSKQLLTQPEFFKEFTTKLKIIKELQDEDIRKNRF